MMVVSQPVLPPTYQPDPFQQSASPNVSVNVNVPRSAAANPPVAPVPFSTLASPFIPTAAHSPPRSNSKMEPPAAEIVVKSSLPPTPDPSPPTTKVLFPVDLVPLAEPAGDGSSSSRKSSIALASQRPGNASPSSSDSQSTNRSSLRSPLLTNGNLPSASHSEVLCSSPPHPHPVLSRSETQPNLSRPVQNRKHSDRDERDRRAKATRRQTMTAPTSVRMVESRSADSRTRLRSTGSKLTRYPALSSDPHPVPGGSSAQSRARRLHAESSTPPPRIVIPSPAADVDDLDFGGPGGLEAKLVLLGSQGVGKTSLILRLTTGSYSAVPAAASLAGSFYKRKLAHNGVPIKLQIWDTAGQERFRSMAPIYYRGAHVCLLVYDISDRKSFQDVRSWLDELHSKASKDMIIYVVGAKTDLERQRAVSFAEARRTIRTWLKPQEPEPEVSPTTESALSALSPVPRSLFRSTSGRKESTSSPPPTGRARPHSMHGLASLMAAATDWADLDSPSTTRTPPPAMPTVIAPSPSPSPAPTVHFPSSLTAPSTSGGPSGTPSIAGSITSPKEGGQEVRKRGHRVSFHAPQPPSEPTATTTVETATASTSHNPSHRHSSRFSISGVLGLTRTTSMSVSDAMSNLTHLAEANPVSPRSPTPRTSFSPTRHRTESSPMLGHDLLPKQRSEEWSSRAWGRGEGPSAADALEEFGASVRNEAASRTTQNNGNRSRGGSLGRDSRLYGHHDGRDTGDEDEDPINGWGVEIENVRLGEVSSLTGEGVEAMCRSIAACLVERKDKIERERTLRNKNSVMLTDPAKDKETKAKGRYACCA